MFHLEPIFLLMELNRYPDIIKSDCFQSKNKRNINYNFKYNNDGRWVIK